jgi:hypothetical protein
MIKVNTKVDQDLNLVKIGVMELDDCVDKHFDDLYDFYLNNGEMPYGVAKARDGDPNQWIFESLERELGV